MRKLLSYRSLLQRTRRKSSVKSTDAQVTSERHLSTPLDDSSQDGEYKAKRKSNLKFKLSEFGKSRKEKTKAKNAFYSIEDVPQPKIPQFDSAPFVPEHETVLFCLNNKDNIPAKLCLDNGFSYFISQSRSEGTKTLGQDCISHASHGRFEVHMLCDGHDKYGHLVAQGICQQLPRSLLKRLSSKEEEVDINDDETMEKIINESFEEASDVVCWTSDGITVGIWVKINHGQWKGKPGYVRETASRGKVRVAVIDDSGYHLPSIERKTLSRPRYAGGCTAIVLIRDKETNLVRAAIAGDSRLVLLPCGDSKDPVLWEETGVSDSGSSTKAWLTPPHNSNNQEEIERLERDFKDAYEFDGNYLVNPVTRFSIQPTRGFGDFDMHGTGHTYIPQITKAFLLKPDSVLLAASDGVFDHQVWVDSDIINCIEKCRKDGLNSFEIGEAVYRETLQRSLEGGYVDDISIFCYRAPKEGESPVAFGETEAEEAEMREEHAMKRSPTSKAKAEARKTIARGGKGFVDIKEGIKNKMKEEFGDLKDIESNPELMASVGGLLKNLAKSKGVTEFDDMDDAELMKAIGEKKEDEEKE